MNQWDSTGPPPGQGQGFGEYDEYGEFHPYARPAGPAGDSGYPDDFEGGAFSPISYERDPHAAAQLTAQLTAQLSAPRRRERAARPRWLLPAALVAALAVGAGAGAMLFSSHTGTRPAATPPTALPSTAPGTGAATGPQPLTMAQAQGVLAAYTSANNAANAKRSDSLLASIETGSSYAIDAGTYRVQQAEKAAPYPAFGPSRARFYIPAEPAGTYPHWFAVQVVNAGLAAPAKVTGTEYLVFTQAAPGAPWLNAVEPYMLAGAAAPQVALGANGAATPVAPDARSLAVTPAQIGALTAAGLDAAGGQGPPAGPANLADRLDQRFWKQRLPSAAVTDRHAPAADGQVFGLRTTDGGALLFYTNTAELTLVPPAGEALHLTIPGFYSPGPALATARIGYLEQLATYVPPRGGSGLRVVADYSGITAVAGR